MENQKIKKYNQKMLSILLTILVVIGVLGLLFIVFYFIGYL